MDNGYNENENEYEEKKEPRKKSRIWSVSALIFAVLSIMLCFVPVLSIIFGLAAIALTIVSRVSIGYFDGVGLASIIVGIFGVVFAFAYIILNLII